MPERKYLTGLVGRDILASRSPWLHECEADALGVRLVYSLFDFADRGWSADELGNLLDAAERIGFHGLNITQPFKQAVIPYLDELSDSARQVNAVNTVSFAGGKRTGYNTDVTGFAESFRSGLPGAALDRAVQLGAGGAGSATAQALLDLGVGHLEVFDTEPARAATLVRRLQQDFGTDRASVGEDQARAMRTADGLVNATPVGMARYPGTPMPPELLDPRHWVADIVYFPLETELLREATRRNCRTLDGSGMVIHQAAEAFDVFTGLRADCGRMTASFKAFIGEGVECAA